MNEKYCPIDVDFKTPNIMIGMLVENIKAGTYEYIENGLTDIEIIEFAILYGKFNKIIARRDNFNNKIKIYQGHGLLRTLKYYLILDMPMKGFKCLAELNGKKFSELSRYYQRRITECWIEFVIDESFWNTNNDIIIKDYTEMIKNTI